MHTASGGRVTITLTEQLQKVDQVWYALYSKTDWLLIYLITTINIKVLSYIAN